MLDYQHSTTLLKALAHPVRLQIVDMLRREPECVCHLSAALARSQPYISQQLAILRRADAIIDEREGTNIFYRLADAQVARLVEAACGPALPGSDHPENRAQGHAAVQGCNCPKCMDGSSEGMAA